MQTIGFTILDATFGSALMLTLWHGWFGFFSHSALRTIGKFSYMIYIIHRPLHPILYKAFAAQHLTARFPAIVNLLVFDVFATSVCIAAAALTWYGYERHWLKLKDLFAEKPHALSLARSA